MRDAHKILSVSRDATIQEIKTAYRRLAFQLHPDKNNGDLVKSEQFKQVTAAYSYLTDPKAKYEYDLHGDGDEEDYPFPSYRKNYSHTPHGQWNPFQSPFQNMKNNHKSQNNNFDGWDHFEFIDLGTGEEIIFGFDKYGRATTSKKSKMKPPKQKKKTNNNNKNTKNYEDSFQEFTSEEIDDIIRNRSSSSETNSNGEYKKEWSNKNNKTNNSNSSSNSKSSQSTDSCKKTRSRRRRRGGDDCTIS